MARRRKMNDTELKQQVERFINNSDWYDNSEVQENFQGALDAYLGRNQKPSVPGEIDFRSEDVADMVEAITAQIMPAFQFDELGAFEPNGKADTSQARLESKITNQVIFDFNDGELTLQEAVKNLLLLRNGIVRVYPAEAEQVEHETHTNVDALTSAQVQNPTAPNQVVEVTSMEEAGEDNITLRIKRTTTLRSLEVASVDPVNFIIEKEWNSINVQLCPVVGERWWATRSELRVMGYPKKVVDNLPRTETDTRIGSLSRNRNNYQPHWETSDKAMERIECFTLYVLMDFDGDGIAERRRVVYAGGTTGGTVLENELTPFVPYACGTGFLYPARFWGLSVYDKLRELEKQKSEGLTQYANNMRNANFPELVIADGDVAETDYTSRRASGVIRADRTDAVREMGVTRIGEESLMFLQYLDSVRAERAGAALDMQSAEAQVASDSAHGAEKFYSARETLATMICNTVGATLVKQMFRLVHETLRFYFGGQTEWHVGAAQYVTADPAQWQQRAKVRVVAGMSAHERNLRRSILEQHLLQQEKLWEAGQDGVLVDYETYFETLIAWSRAGGLQTPRRFWVDPQSDGALQALQGKRQAALEAQQRQDALQRLIFETQILIGDEDRRADLAKHFSELAHKYWSDTLSSEMEELRTQAQGAVDADPDPELIDRDQAVGRIKALAQG